MKMLVADSLFSLEFIVEKLKVFPGVRCRLPAVAFRFLDYPTIPIHLLDTELKTRLQDKVYSDRDYKLGDQLYEYHDKDGYFVFSTGKSCLYKIPPDTLGAQLSKIPLYIIIADDLPKQANLVGCAMLSLETTYKQVYEDLIKHGVSLPTSNGVRSSLNVTNLMGQTVGQIIVGCRIISLGMALLTHLPDDAVTPAMNQENTTPDRGDNSPEQLITNIQLKQSLTDIKDTKLEKEFPLVLVEKSTNTDHVTEKTSDKQTQSRLNKKIKLNLKSADHDLDFVGPEIYCPPALYYNKEAEGQAVKKYDEDKDVESIASSLESFTYHSERNAKLQPKPEPENKADEKKSQTSQHHPTRDSVHQTSDSPLQQILSNAHKLPILTALVNELAQLANTPGSDRSRRHHDTCNAPDRSPRLVSPLSLYSPPAQSSPKSLSRRTSARRLDVMSGAYHSPAETSRPGSRVADTSRPGSKIGHRPGEVPQTSATKGPLIYGSTMTQKLRLLKTNPDYLRRIEDMEAEIERKRGGNGRSRTRVLVPGDDLRIEIPKGKVKGGPSSFRSYVSHHLDVSTEMSRLATELAEVKNELNKRRPASSIDQKIQPVSADLGVTRIITPTGVIAPAKSQTPRKQEKPHSTRRDVELSNISEIPSQSFDGHTRKSLEVHLPTANIHDADETENSSRSRHDSQKQVSDISHDYSDRSSEFSPPYSDRAMTPGLQRMDSVRFAVGSPSPLSRSLNTPGYNYDSSSFESLSHTQTDT